MDRGEATPTCVDLRVCRACLERAFRRDSASSSRTGVRYDLQRVDTVSVCPARPQEDDVSTPSSGSHLQRAKAGTGRGCGETGHRAALNPWDPIFLV